MFKEQLRKKISTRNKKEKPSIFFKTVYCLTLIAFFTVTVYSLLFSSFMRINYLNLRGTEELKYEEVYSLAKALTSGKYLDIFPKDNFLLVSKK